MTVDEVLKYRKGSVLTMNALLRDFRKTYGSVEEPGVLSSICCTQVSKINQETHYKCMRGSFAYAFTQKSGVYGLDIDTGLGKTFTAVYILLLMLHEKRLKADDFIFVSQNTDLSALDSVLTSYPEFEYLRSSFLDRYVTYASFSMHWGVAPSLINNMVKQSSILVYDEAHMMATPKMLPISKTLIKRYRDKKVIVATTAIGHRYDDLAMETKDFFKLVLKAKMLYEMRANEAFELDIMLSPRVYTLTTDASLDKMIKQLEKSGVLSPVVIAKLPTMTRADKLDLISKVSSKDLKVDITSLADELFMHIKQFQITGKLRCMVVGDTIADLGKDVASLVSMLTVVASMMGKKLNYIRDDYTGEIDKTERTKMLQNFESNSYGVEQDCFNVHILAGVYAISRSIHPSGLHLLLMSRNAKASQLREQVLGRCVSVGNIIPVFAIDCYDVFEYGLRSVLSVQASNTSGGSGSLRIRNLITLFPDLDSLYAYVKFELQCLTDEQLEEICTYVMDKHFDCAIEDLYKDLANKWGISDLTVKVLLERLGVTRIDFKSGSSCQFLLIDAIVSGISQRMHIQAVGDFKYDLENGKSLDLASSKVIIDGVDYGIDISSVFSVGQTYDRNYYQNEIDKISKTVVSLVA